MLIRDLMVNLAARAAGGAVPAYFPCEAFSGCWCSWYTCGGSCAWSYCGYFSGGCGGFSGCGISGCGGSATPGCPQFVAAIDPAAASQQLGVLKAQLQQALLQIEQQEQALAQSSQPQTLAQVEERERMLREELAKLDKRKKELEKK